MYNSHKHIDGVRFVVAQDPTPSSPQKYQGGVQLYLYEADNATTVRKRQKNVCANMNMLYVSFLHKLAPSSQ